MTWLDILILVMLGLSGLMGWHAGVVRGAINIGGVFLAVFLGGQFGEPLGRNLDFVSDPNLAKVIGFAIVFGVVVIAAWIVSLRLGPFLQLILPPGVDHLGGAAFGLVVGTMIWTGAIVAAASFPFGGVDDAIQESGVATFLANRSPIVLRMLPEKYQGVLSLVREGAQIPQATLSRVAFTEASPSRVALEVGLALDNPNRFSGTIELIQYRIFWDRGGRLDLLGTVEQKNLRLQARGMNEFKLSLEVLESANPAVPELYADLQKMGSVPLRVNGTLTVAFLAETLDVPFLGAKASGKSQ